jgi:hypothetical protein
MDYQPPSQPFLPPYTPQLPLPSLFHERLGTENLLIDGPMQLFPLSHNQGSPFLSQVVQPPQSNNAMFQHYGFDQNQLSFSLDSMPTAITAHQSHFPVTGETDDIHVQSMAPPSTSRKRKAPTLRDEDWEPVRARVIELHITQKLPLPDVKKLIEEEFKSFGFTATLVY